MSASIPTPAMSTEHDPPDLRDPRRRFNPLALTPSFLSVRG